MSCEPQNVPQKQCTGPCGQLLPATTEFFHKGNGKYGLKGICKKCRSKPHKGDIIDGKKHCPKCDKWKPATTEYFGLNKNIKSGFATHCKECRHEYNVEHAEEMRQYQRNRHQNDRERVNHLARLNYHKHGEHNRQHKRQYRKEHPDITRATNKRWDMAHPEQVRNYHRGYRKNNPDKIVVYHQRRRARKKAIPGILTATQVQEKLKQQHYCCYYAKCGFSKFPKVNGRYVFEIEHTIPVSRTEASPRHDINHVVLSCIACNRSKRNKLPHEWPEGGRLF